MTDNHSRAPDGVAGGRGAPAPVRGHWAIVAENAVVAVFAIVDGWTVGSLMWIYWWQSVVIGVFSYRRMMALKRFSTEGFTSNGRRVPEDESGKRSTARFFALHYGIFHGVYLVFLLTRGAAAEVGPILLLTSVVGFCVAHWQSWRTNVEADQTGCPNLGTLMFLPYARIVPMHLTLVFGAGVAFAGQGAWVLFFTALKTAADVLMHVVEHRVLRRNRAALFVESR